MLHRFRAQRLAALALAVLAFNALAAGPKAYVGNFKDSTVSVIDTDAGTVVATIPVAAGPHGMVMSADGRTVYVSGDGSSTVNVIDTATDRVAASIDVGPTPHGLALTPDGRTLLVAIYGADRVAFVDTATRTVVGSAPAAKPHTIAVRPDGKEAYVASQQPGAFALVVLDLVSRAVARTIALDKPPRDLEFGHDGRALYFTQAGVDAVQVLDPASDRVVAQIPTGASPHIAGFFRGAPAGTAVVQGPGELLLFDPATQKPLRPVAVGKQPHWMAPARDGGVVYVTNEGSNDVTVVDLASGATRTIAVGNAPRKVVVQQGGMRTGAARVSIAHFAFAPGVLEVPVGTPVTWSNDDGAPHGIAYADKAAGTDVLLPGATFARTFDRPGTYDYVCAVHPYMQGKIVVRAP
jgi:YVTN family beta-propeller protein